MTPHNIYSQWTSYQGHPVWHQCLQSCQHQPWKLQHCGAAHVGQGFEWAHFLLIPLICFQKVDNVMHLHSSERSQIMVDLIVDPWKTGMFGRGIRQKRRFKSNRTRWRSKWSDKVTFHFDGSPRVVLKCFDGVFHVGSWSWALCFSVRAPVSPPNELSFKLAFVWL